MRDHIADDENGGTAVDLFDQIRQFVERSNRGLRIAPRHTREVISPPVKAPLATKL